ncbi:LLM class flavin-dependent oxidoreductase [Streptomyces sp. SID8361]|uniref:LLM class flavin-dependent oxidoreductase n=1 Tax=Streptomyces sp. MnatMP-M27 TaxID=1839768 RepID=UPI00081F33D9|nr:LLM class flavin-dependent oxidoreductase [Streptomyces sp. MnatMP-M27]MYU11097.1 LLM class flavin-dependent oxidoreductase [Streptomyces sp. SID8361]SCF78246.1 Flavin-dependent oxidoreductase, luciferase family (includes alkanesulfonate monooxygenase SsuD and methylene tetrahydromethanopterin reductase) [Streptomyces sp. MnatMP-M27]
MTSQPRIGVELPAAAVNGLLSQDSDLAGLLDASGAGYAVLGADRAQGAPSLNPTVAAALLARRTTCIGLVVAASPQRDHPYNVARRVASVDHISHGRVGLLGLFRDSSVDLGIGDGSTWTDRTIGAEELADALLAARALWRTWPFASLDPDPGIAEAARLPYADHVGIFSTKGPLNVPTTPQGEPLVFWSAPSGQLADQLSAASIADVVFTDAGDVTMALAGAVADLAAAGRPLQLHARARTLAEAEALIDAPGIAGVLVRPSAEELRDVLTDLPSPAAGTSRNGTLRDRLGVPARVEPDLSDNEIAFPSPAKESA